MADKEQGLRKPAVIPCLCFSSLPRLPVQFRVFRVQRVLVESPGALLLGDLGGAEVAQYDLTLAGLVDGLS
jgi:hypothetical protein